MSMLQRRRSDASSIVDGDLEFCDDDFRRIARRLQEATGIHLTDNKATLVYSRLAKRLRTLGLTSFRAYCDLVDREEADDERRRLIMALTTNVTSFFREPHHFDALRNAVLPPLLEAARAGRRVRLWSAGCSRGHEPYSIAMTILSLLPEAADLDVRILASDIDTDVLAEAARGHYDDSALAQVPAALRSRYFTPVAGGEPGKFAVHPAMRALVAFRPLNLVGSWPMRGRFDVIFCRNVVIYFDDATQDRVWTRFVGQLGPDGYLFIGHSERLSPAIDPLFASVGVTAYRRRAGVPS